MSASTNIRLITDCNISAGSEVIRRVTGGRRYVTRESWKKRLFSSTG